MVEDCTVEVQPIELEEAFDGAYRSCRIDGRSGMDVETFFNRIGWALIDLIRGELNCLNLARVQTTTWIRFYREDEEGQERVELAINSLMMNVYRGSDLGQMVLGQNPPGQNPPRQNPLDKIPLDKIPPRTKSPWTKSPHYIPPNCSIAQYFLLYINVIFEGQFSSTFVRCDIFHSHA